MRPIVPSTASIAEFVVDEKWKDLPVDVVTAAQRAIADTVGVTLAAAGEDVVATLVEAAGRHAGAGISTLVTDGSSAPTTYAALVNGTAAHALDYDDVTDSTKAHPSSPMVPALLALGERSGASGHELVVAYAVGFQVGCVLADAMDIAAHYDLGWHATGTIGVMGATAAACRLLGASVDETRSALGIAASSAAGSRANFGSMTKPLHVGLAAQSAVFATELALTGFTASLSELEDPMGFFAVYGEQGRDVEVVDDAPGLSGEEWYLVSRGVGVKKYPCCFFTHRAVDATIELANAHDVDPDDVRTVEVFVEPLCLRTLVHPRPHTGLEAKFSMEYVVAAALVDRALTLTSFQQSSVDRRDIRAILPRIEATETTAPPLGAGDSTEPYAVVRLILTDGREVMTRVDSPRGHADSPLSEEELRAKFVDCVRFSGTGLDPGDTWERVRDLDRRPQVSGTVWPQH